MKRSYIFCQIFLPPPQELLPLVAKMLSEIPAQLYCLGWAARRLLFKKAYKKSRLLSPCLHFRYQHLALCCPQPFVNAILFIFKMMLLLLLFYFYFLK